MSLRCTMLNEKCWFFLTSVVSVLYLLYTLKFYKESLSFREKNASLDEELFFEIDRKLRFLFENIDHRTDFLTHQNSKISISLDQANTKEILDECSKRIRKRSYKLKAELEKLYLFNKFKEKKVKEISAAIQARIDRLQNEKCRIDNLVACTLEQEYCGFGCHLHTYSVAFIISYYWGRTLVFTANQANGMQDFFKIFQPVAKKCKFQTMSKKYVIENSIIPFTISSQEHLEEKLFDQFNTDVHKIAKYHSDPQAFIIGHLMSFVMRYNQESEFYHQLQKSKMAYNISRPYVGIQIRRSDKFTEAKFYEVEEYMKYVEEFYEIYFLKYPERANTTQRAVYVATDELEVYDKLQSKYADYVFYYNNSFTKLAAAQSQRSSKQGFEGFLNDVYFLSNADHIVCTFTSNVCRLAYELLTPRHMDTYQLAKSLDTHYYNVFQRSSGRIAVLDYHGRNFALRKGTLLVKTVYYGPVFEGYTHDGFMTLKPRGSDQLVTVPSYTTKDYY